MGSIRCEAIGPLLSRSYLCAFQLQEQWHGVAMPGLVDAHGHAGHSLIRTMADDLGAWMDACQRVYLHGATPEFWRADARLTALERLTFGTTACLSMLGGAGDITDVRPASPLTASPQNRGRPIKTDRAPSANALKMSEPRRMPPSM